jgi:hypothetical protein
VRERIEYLQQGVSMRIALPAEEFCRTWEDCIAWKNLPEDKFMTEYGDAVLAEYNIPTPEEIERIQQYDELQQNQDEDQSQQTDDSQVDDSQDDEDDDEILQIYD